MKRKIFTFESLLAMGILTAVAGPLDGASQEPFKRQLLLKTDLEGIEGREGNVLLVELPPGAESGKHTHPGAELAYVLEGAVTVEIEGRDPVTVKSGSAIHVAPGDVHNLKNAGKEPVKAVVFGIFEKGRPMVIPVK
jgi:quercetin dioxygenase-like cupin family protein